MSSTSTQCLTSAVDSIEDNADGGKVKVVAVPVVPKRGTSIEDRDCQVEQTAEPPLSIEASYVVGCDGANSTVRRLRGFTTTDLNFQSDWLVLDIVSYPRNLLL